MKMSGLYKVGMPGFMNGRRPMKTEPIALSQKERNRLKVLRDVERGRLKQLEAEER
jgi:hypothetical protein